MTDMDEDGESDPELVVKTLRMELSVCTCLMPDTYGDMHGAMRGV